MERSDKHQNKTSSSSSRGEETKEVFKYYLSLPNHEVIKTFAMLGLIQPEWTLRHEQLIKVMGKQSYIRLGMHCHAHGKDGGGKLFTWMLNREARK